MALEVFFKNGNCLHAGRSAGHGPATSLAQCRRFSYSVIPGWFRHHWLGSLGSAALQTHESHASALFCGNRLFGSAWKDPSEDPPAVESTFAHLHSVVSRGHMFVLPTGCNVGLREPLCSCKTPDQPLVPLEKQTCRVCWSDSDPFALVQPCDCSGSMQHIHLECLQQWQRMLWQSGQFRKALHCDVCQQPYKQPFHSFPLQQRLPLLARARQLLLRLYHNPELALKAWRCWVILGGLAAGTHRGVTGFRAGLAVGLKSALPVASCTLRLVPQFSMLAAMLPHLQPFLRAALRCSCAVMLAEVVLASAAGLLSGGVLGFCLGTFGVVRLTAQGSCHAATSAAALASWLASWLAAWRSARTAAAGLTAVGSATAWIGSAVKPAGAVSGVLAAALQRLPAQC